MPSQIPVTDAALAPESQHDHLHEIAPDIAYLRWVMVNVVFLGAAGSDDWVLVDTGLPGAGSAIRNAAAHRFGVHARPRAIILTHGHVDHVGSVKDLADEWAVPVYASANEAPFLNGECSYPPPDPTVGGLMALSSPLFSRGPIDIRRWLRPLPADHSVPFLPEWKWIAVPGHTAGQVALWRERDRALLSADAIITTQQESAYAVALQKPEIHGPPMYFTPDWVQAAASARALAGLHPELLLSGHGRAMQGPEMQSALRLLADDFEHIAVPHDKQPGIQGA